MLDKIERIKYPKQVDSCSRPDMTLGIEAKLYTPTAQEYNEGKKNPLEMHSKFSVFKFSLISGSNTNGKAQVVSANIPAQEIKAIFDNTQAVLPVLLQMSIDKKKPNKVAGGSLAFTHKLTIRKYNQKSPAEVLIENPGNKTDLLGTKKWLEDNLVKYPRNQAAINAIEEAIKLLDEGKLNSSTESFDVVLPIFPEIIKVPFAKKVDKDGCTNIYSIGIFCDTSRRMPFMVRIMNCMAPPIEDESGTITADMTHAKEKKEYYLYMSKEEWLKVCHQCKDTLDNFERTRFPVQWDLADKYDYHPEKQRG